MADATHTPGPWRFDPCNKTLFGSDYGITHSFLDGTSKTCAELGHCPTECGPMVFAFDGKKSEDSTPSAEDRALIEAAPDLLAALQALVALEADNSSDFAGEPEKYAAARVAVAKATGSAA